MRRLDDMQHELVRLAGVWIETKHPWDRKRLDKAIDELEIYKRTRREVEQYE